MRFDSDRFERFDHWMESYVDRRRFAGCSLLIAQDGKEVYFNAHGKRDLKSGKPFERDTIARIYSMTKPVTSVLLMMLVERGLFHLDAPVSEFIPAFSDMRCLVQGATSLEQTEQCVTPTLHQLLTHTSGLSYPFNSGVLADEMSKQDMIFRSDQGDLSAMVERIAALPLAFRPGARWEYSVGIDIIGRVVEVVTGKTLEEVFVDEIFDPLGMKDTRFSVPVVSRGRFAALYTPLAGSAFYFNEVGQGGESLRLVDDSETSTFFTTSLFSGGGGLVGTIDDYLRFTEMLRTGGRGLISPKTLEFMMCNHLPGDIASMGPQSFAEQPMEGMGFGIGGAVLLDPGRARVPGSYGDFSWGGMASTFFWIDPKLDLSVIFFTQLTPSSSYPARAQLKALIHGAMT